jgi:aspartate aminotransferase
VSKNLDKEYAPIHGVGDYVSAAAKLAFGENSDVVKNGLVIIETSPSSFAW